MRISFLCSFACLPLLGCFSGSLYGPIQHGPGVERSASNLSFESEAALADGVDLDARAAGDSDEPYGLDEQGVQSEIRNAGLASQASNAKQAIHAEANTAPAAVVSAGSKVGPSPEFIESSPGDSTAVAPLDPKGEPAKANPASALLQSQGHSQPNAEVQPQSSTPVEPLTSNGAEAQPVVPTNQKESAPESPKELASVEAEAQPLSNGPHKPTQVYVLGMIHSRHRSSELWSLDRVRSTIESIDPDVICVEIPPANWPGTLATWKESKTVTDSRAKVFPEYTDVVLPLTDEMSFTVEPCAGWTPEMAKARRASIEKFETSGEPAEAYKRDLAWISGWLEEHPAPSAEDDPFYIHTPLYDLRTKAELGPYEHHLNGVIGAPGGWTYINEEHFALIETAINKHAGKRVLITFGAGHKYWFLEQLRAMQNVEVMDVRPHMPDWASKETLTADKAAEEFLIGFDSLRAFWSHSRTRPEGAKRRIQRMLTDDLTPEFVSQLMGTKGMHASEFEDGPFVNSVDIRAGKKGAMHVSAWVQRVAESSTQASRITVTLSPDPARPGGFVWKDLELPRWLLER